MNRRRRYLLHVALLASTAISCGCVKTLRSGAQSVLQRSGPISHGVALGAGIGLGDASMAMAFEGDASFAVDTRTGRAEGSFLVGPEVLHYIGDRDLSKEGNHLGVFFGAKLGSAPNDGSFVLLARYTHA